MVRKNPGVAAVFSFFFPGLGQIYNGELSKGITVVIFTIVGWLLTCIYIGFIILIILWVWAMSDAYKTAERINTLSQEDENG